MIGFVKNIEILNVYLERARKTECNDEVFVFHLMIFLRNFHSSYQITLKVKYKTNTTCCDYKRCQCMCQN